VIEIPEYSLSRLIGYRKGAGREALRLDGRRKIMIGICPL